MPTPLKSQISHLKSLLLCASVSLCALCSPSTRADDGWSITTADFKRQSANLKSLDDSGAKIVPFGSTTETTY